MQPRISLDIGKSTSVRNVIDWGKLKRDQDKKKHFIRILKNVKI